MGYVVKFSENVGTIMQGTYYFQDIYYMQLDGVKFGTMMRTPFIYEAKVYKTKGFAEKRARVLEDEYWCLDLEIIEISASPEK